VPPWEFAVITGQDPMLGLCIGLALLGVVVVWLIDYSSRRG
jgi:hypothetical protein